ncbi:hypothetical protein LEP1GSC133_2736 [Leptospira borgpetersenii serovar Pomona str. 200901868]|uniref:Uncharacterized protein n=2 Tax=Leptospira borgpetersenii TaxID=174 RepID=A0A0S2IMU1_LEPBO|nr:hypothetical protein LBBP_00606 [Leptospira borgpetersenii serovar Ballum]EKR02186.1 hypothetical protein LEP1GSC121_0895 [Leptospira borgpetersenii serovar Castellonis str. 200801910]EMO09370.1 hypothetical protein LEP1GSC137_2054 [Leptospira borgpetersenii str. Noumea 25]EMO64934.1 hypothetical protein LEP1GSC133_2736 [Leptospira borgpetersenii serovar Pomona str. 200901868]
MFFSKKYPDLLSSRKDNEFVNLTFKIEKFNENYNGLL